MKKLLLFAVLVFAAPLARAADPAPVNTITFIGTNPVYAADGTLTSAPVQAMFKSTMTIDDKSFDLTPAPNVTWDGTDKKRTITVDGIELTYDQVTRAAGAIANKELGGGAGTQKKAAADKAAADAAAAKAAADAAALAAPKPAP